ncbi:STAS domain-containing protein [Pedococcus cremeus]|uniref:STAS domain-containing protein n=1 Tax=Pedococcus cremeus TaxID=587636 RepID=UPI0015A51861|nr:STAS domain-containing protein [Pedococcus cremeus]
MRDLSVRLATESRRVRLDLAGELDVASKDLLEPVVDQVLLLQPPRVLVDLRRLWFCDVAGARALAGAHKRWSDHGLSVALYGAGLAVQRVFDLTGFADLLG